VCEKGASFWHLEVLQKKKAGKTKFCLGKKKKECKMAQANERGGEKRRLVNIEKKRNADMKGC